MRLKQTFKQRIEDRLHVVYGDIDTQTSFVYAGERITDTDEVLRRLRQILRTQTYQPGGVYWVWRQLEALTTSGRQGNE